MRLDYHGTKAYIKLECENSGKGVEFHKAGEIPGPHTDGTTIHLFHPNGEWNEDQWLRWEYECYHEIGHESPENNSPHWRTVVEEKKIASGSFFGMVMNFVSDHIQEHNRVGKYVGRDRVLKAGREAFTRDTLLSEEVMGKEYDTEKGQAFKAMSVWDVGQRATWNELMVGLDISMRNQLFPSERAFYNKLYKSGIRVDEGKNEWDTYELAKRIISALGFDAEEEEKKAQEQFEKGKDGKGEKGKEGKKGKGKSGEGKDGESKEQAEMDSVIYHVHWKENSETSTSYNTSMNGVHLEYPSEMTGGGYVPREGFTINMKTQEYGRFASRLSGKNSYAQDIKRIDGGRMLVSSTRMLLISMAQTRWEHGHRRGVISGKNLWKGCGPFYDQDVHKKRTTKLELDTAVCVLCDHSGSMSGNKFVHASKAGIMLNEAMAKSNIPIELLGFTETYDGPVHAIIKPFSELRVDEDELASRYGKAGNIMSNNADGDSILWAYSRLIKRKEKRKVLIVLSDGSPAAYNSGDVYGFTRRVIKQIEDGGKMEIYGIGIMDSNVKALYKHHKVLSKASELENMLIGLVKSQIIGKK